MVFARRKNTPYNENPTTIKGTIMNVKQTTFAIVWIASTISLIDGAIQLVKNRNDKKNSK